MSGCLSRPLSLFDAIIFQILLTLGPPPFQGKDIVVPPSVLQKSSLFQIIGLDRDDQYLMVPIPLMQRAGSQ